MRLVMFDLYLQPSEALGLRVADAAAPVASSPHRTAFWSFTIRPWEGGRPSKTEAFGDTVVMDREDRQLPVPDELHRGLEREKVRGRPARHGVSTLSCNHVSKRCAAELNLSLAPHQARHRGATHDRWDRARSLEEVRKRVRWRSEYSTRRYERHWKLQERLGSLHPSTLENLK